MSPIERADLTATFVVAEDWDQLHELEDSDEVFAYVVIPHLVRDRYIVVPRAEIGHILTERSDRPLAEAIGGRASEALTFERTGQGIGAAERIMRREGTRFGVVVEHQQVVGLLVDESRGYLPPEAEAPRADGGGGAGGDRDETDAEREELYLQAIVEELTTDRESITRMDGFARGGRHRLSVSLATAASTTGVVADQPVPLDVALPHVLAVSFYSDWLAKTEPQEITTQPGQAVTAAAVVEFQLPPDLARVEIVIVIHERIDDGQKLIQTAVVAGDAVASGSEGSGLTLLVEPAPSRPVTAESPDVSLVLDDVSLAVYARSPSARVRIPDDTSEFRASLGQKVLELWADLEAAQTADSLTTAIVKLAARGRDVWEVLDRNLDTDSATKQLIMHGDGAIQLLTRDLDTDLPIEFVYDGPTPDLSNPRLCSGHNAALGEAACRSCENRANDICPFDFWGLRRRIERHVVDQTDGRPGTPVRFGRTDQTLDKSLQPALFGASALVQPARRTAVREALAEIGAPVIDTVPGWVRWISDVRTIEPKLLVLLAHSQQAGEITLEIENQPQERAWIDSSYVNATKREPGPMVLLTGCETARPEIGFLSFVSKFLDSGAAVVVGTLALITPDTAARATAQILRVANTVLDSDLALAQRSVGEIIRRTRCRLLADGDLTGFNLVAYGDADWRFAQ